MSCNCFVALLHEATDMSAVCDCGISSLYSLTNFVVLLNFLKFLLRFLIKFIIRQSKSALMAFVTYLFGIA